jgi:hypothetical protein
MMIEKHETGHMEYNIPDCFHGPTMDTQEAHPTFAVVAENGAVSNYNRAER